MLSVIIPWLVVVLFFSFGILATFGRWDIVILAWLPSVIVAITIITTCIVIIPAEQFPAAGHWSGYESPSYGYSNNMIYPPGYEGFKSPFEHVTIIPLNYHNINIYVPTQTRDGMRIYFVLSFLHVKWQPQAFASQFNHDESNFEKHIINVVKPTVDRIMATKSEADIELNGGNTNDQIYEAVLPLIHPHTYLIHKQNIPTEHHAYFYHIDSPQFNYACSGIGGGYCSYGDSLGLPQAPNRYTGQAIPYKSRVTEQPTPEPTIEYTYMDDSNAPSTQAEVNAMIDEVLAMPQFQ